MAIPLSITRDINGYPTTGSETGLRFTDLGQYFTLSGVPGTVTSVTVPANPSPTFGGTKMLAIFEFALATEHPVVWVLPAASPALTLPSGTVTLTTAVLNPPAREVIPGQVLQLASPQASVAVSITYYAIQ